MKHTDTVSHWLHVITVYSLFDDSDPVQAGPQWQRNTIGAEEGSRTQAI